MKRVFAVILISALLLCGCAPKSPAKDYDGAVEIAQSLRFDDASENSDARVTLIGERAKTDAAHMTDKLADQALSYLAASFSSDPYESNFVMESCMYFGALLDFAYDDDLAEAGWDAFKAIKDVYRGWGTKEDAAFARENTVDNLTDLGYLTSR